VTSPRVATLMPAGVGAAPLLPGWEAVRIVAAANGVQLMAAPMTGPANWPMVASLHREQLIA
jgi:hypothetical protein